MLLAIDVGNTHIVFGLYEGRLLKASWRIQSNVSRSVDEYALELLGLLSTSGCRQEEINSAVMCCVVPSLTRVFSKLSQKYFSTPALIVGPGVKTGMPLSVDDPRMVGADRVVNAVAAKHLVGTPAIVVDFGTATSFDVVNREGCFEGGIIAPGVLVSAQALFDKAALLPSLELKTPQTLIGKNTTDAMLSGIVYGYVGLVQGLLKRIKEDLISGPSWGPESPASNELNVVATGGLANMIAQEADCFTRVVPNLTLLGLQYIAELNS